MRQSLIIWERTASAVSSLLLAQTFDILQCLPTTQRTQAGAVEPHVLLDRSAVGPGIQAHRPLYRFLQGKIPSSQWGIDAGIQQLEIRFDFAGELA
jgi:hypothetical protein